MAIILRFSHSISTFHMPFTYLIHLFSILGALPIFFWRRIYLKGVVRLLMLWIFIGLFRLFKFSRKIFGCSKMKYAKFHQGFQLIFFHRTSKRITSCLLDLNKQSSSCLLSFLVNSGNSLCISESNSLRMFIFSFSASEFCSFFFSSCSICKIHLIPHSTGVISLNDITFDCHSTFDLLLCIFVPFRNEPVMTSFWTRSLLTD